MASYGYTFQSGDGVTPTRLNAARTVSDIVNADIASAAAIDKTKISGTAITAADTGTVTSAMIADGTIVNADVNASAAIAGTKISPDFGAQNVTTTGTLSSGNITSTLSTFGGLSLNCGATSGNSEIVSRRARGTLVSPTVVQNGDTILTLAGQGYDGSTYRNAAFINLAVGAAAGSGDMPGLITLSTTADGESSPTERMRINASGNVGIGTSSPTVKLDVSGFLRSVGQAIVEGLAGTFRFFRLTTNGVVRWDVGATDGSESGSNAGSDFFIHRFSDAGAFLERVLHVSRATGNVGIGTSSPSQKLDVNGAIMSANLLLQGDGTHGYIRPTNANSALYLGSNNANQAVINASGNMGIGTLSPSTELEVNGTVTATAFVGNLTGTASAIADGTVSTAKIVDSAVTNAKIASGVDASKLTTGTLPIARIADAAVTPSKLSQRYTLATTQNSTSGTSIDFTGIPSWAKRITVMLDGVSTNGTSAKLIQLGDSGGFESTGYLGGSQLVQGATGFGGAYSTAGIPINSVTATDAVSGAVVFSLLSQENNTWVAQGAFRNSSIQTSYVAGSKSLSGALDSVRITTVNGTDTFDAGTINISYEG